MTLAALEGLRRKKSEAMENKIRKAIRDIELLLGPSFPIDTFARALQHELKLLGIRSHLFSSLKDYYILQLEGQMEILIPEATVDIQPGKLGSQQAVWIPHERLLLPVRQAVA